MGHIRVGVLPKYPRWRVVIEMLGDTGSSASGVANKVLDNTNQILSGGSSQTCLGYCIWLLAQLTLAARTEDFVEKVGELKINIRDKSSATEFLASLSQESSSVLSAIEPYTAINNISAMALRETLTKTIGLHSNTLFGQGMLEVQSAFKNYSTQKKFGDLIHIFFTSFLRRLLHFIIDKEIANHIGPGRRFENLREIEDFEESLSRFSSQTTRIIDEFSGGWYSKKIWQEGVISESDATKFVHVAIEKLRTDLALNEVK